MRIEDRGAPAGRHNGEMLAVPPELQDCLYSAHPEWWGRVDGFHILSFSTLSNLASYTNVVIGDHLGVTTVRDVAALEFFILVPMQFLFVADHCAAGYDYHDLCMSHGSCGVTTPLSSGVRRQIDYHGWAQLVAGCAFDPEAAHLAYRSSAEMDW